MTRKGRAGIVAGLIAAFVVGLGFSEAPPPEKVLVPMPTPTVTVTASPESPPAPALPEECVSYLEKAKLVPAAVAAYEQNLGATKVSQDLAVQGIMKNSIAILNEARQLLIDLENKTVSSLTALSNLENELTASAKACQRASAS